MTIPDAPHLPPYVLAIAEFDGCVVRWIDEWAAKRACNCSRTPTWLRRYSIGAGRPISKSGHDLTCTLVTDKRQLPLVMTTDDEAEARRVFEAEAARLTTPT